MTKTKSVHVFVSYFPVSSFLLFSFYYYYCSLPIVSYRFKDGFVAIIINTITKREVDTIVLPFPNTDILIKKKKKKRERERRKRNREERTGNGFF
jgi:hypothetical protein